MWIKTNNFHLFFSAEIPKYDRDDYSFELIEYDKSSKSGEDSDDSEKNNSDLDFLSDEQKSDVEMDCGSSD